MIHEPVLIQDYHLKPIVHSDFLTFYLMSFFCLRIPPRLPRDTGSPRLPRRLLAVAVFQTFLAPVVLTVLRSTEQVFRGETPLLGFT